MIGNITNGQGFRGCLDYVLGKDRQPALIGGNMMGETARTLAQEFGSVRVLKQKITKPVWHISLSSVVGEDLSHEQWSEITKDYLIRMGININNHQYIVIRHTDKQHDHVHIIVNRIGADGKVYHNSHDRYTSKKVLREIERERGLTPVHEKRKERIRERSR